MPDLAEVAVVPPALRRDVETLWRYHDMGHAPRRCDVGLGLGSHDLGVAVIAADLYAQGMFPWLVFSGANSPTTRDRFPQGEAVSYRDYVVANGVPGETVLIEPAATNTQENIEFTRELLAARDICVGSLLVMSRPYQQRRAYATCRRLWPEVEVVCYSRPLPLDEYVASIGDARRVIDMLVGDTQRIDVYAQRGFAIPQEIPDEVRVAFANLVAAGYTSRLI